MEYIGIKDKTLNKACHHIMICCSNNLFTSLEGVG